MIYPAHAGINPIRRCKKFVNLNLPRTRGDKPLAHQASSGSTESTPHTRG